MSNFAFIEQFIFVFAVIRIPDMRVNYLSVFLRKYFLNLMIQSDETIDVNVPRVLIIMFV